MSQTLGHASSLIMKARLQFVAPQSVPAKHRLLQALHGQSVLSRLQKKSARSVHLSAACAQSNHLESKRMHSAFKRTLALAQKASYKSASLLQPREPRFFSRYQSTGSVRVSVGQLVPPALVCSAIQIQSTAVAHRAWPNPSFKRTGLRPAA